MRVPSCGKGTREDAKLHVEGSGTIVFSQASDMLLRSNMESRTQGIP